MLYKTKGKIVLNLQNQVLDSFLSNFLLMDSCNHCKYHKSSTFASWMWTTDCLLPPCSSPWRRSTRMTWSMSSIWASRSRPSAPFPLSTRTTKISTSWLQFYPGIPFPWLPSSMRIWITKGRMGCWAWVWEWTEGSAGRWAPEHLGIIIWMSFARPSWGWAIAASEAKFLCSPAPDAMWRSEF